MTIRRILLQLSTIQNTTPRLDIPLQHPNILLDHINQHNTSLYIREQCTTIKTYPSLLDTGCIIKHPPLVSQHFRRLKIPRPLLNIVMQLNYDRLDHHHLYRGGEYIVEDGNMLNPRVSQLPSRLPLLLSSPYTTLKISKYDKHTNFHHYHRPAMLCL